MGDDGQLTGEIGQCGGEQSAGEEQGDGQQTPRALRRRAVLSDATDAPDGAATGVAAQPRRPQRRQRLPTVARRVTCNSIQFNFNYIQ